MGPVPAKLIAMTIAFLVATATTAGSQPARVTYRVVTVWEQFSESGRAAVTSRVVGIGASRERPIGTMVSTGVGFVLGVRRGDLGEMSLWSEEGGEPVYLEIGFPVRAEHGGGGLVLRPMIVRGPYARRDDSGTGDYRYETAFAPGIELGAYAMPSPSVRLGFAARVVLTLDQPRLIPGFRASIGVRAGS